MTDASWQDTARRKLIGFKTAAQAATAAYRSLTDQATMTREAIRARENRLQALQMIGKPEDATLRQIEELAAEIERLQATLAEIEQQRERASRASAPLVRLHREAERIAVAIGIISREELTA